MKVKSEYGLPELSFDQRGKAECKKQNRNVTGTYSKEKIYEMLGFGFIFGPNFIFVWS